VEENIEKPNFAYQGLQITEDQIWEAMKNTRSNHEAARWMQITYITYKKYASKYIDRDTGKTLFELHMNQSAKGIPKFGKRRHDKASIIDIMEEKVPKTFVSVKVLKTQIIQQAILEEKCCRCGYQEKRVIDYKVPLILNFKDGDKRNWKLENVEFLCYNCYFMCVGEVFTNKQLSVMEDYTDVRPVKIDLDLPVKHEQAIKDSVNLENDYIYIEEKKPDDFGSDLIANSRR
jgi:5-methylcytosine-specific restriction endonuclease McrA